MQILRMSVTALMFAMCAVTPRGAPAAGHATIYVGELGGGGDDLGGKSISAGALSSTAKKFKAVPGTVIGHGLVTPDGNGCESPPVTIDLPRGGKSANAVIRFDEHCEMRVVKPPRAMKKAWRRERKEMLDKLNARGKNAQSSSFRLHWPSFPSAPRWPGPTNGPCMVRNRRAWVLGRVYDVIMLRLTETSAAFEYYDNGRSVWNGHAPYNGVYASPFFPTWYVERWRWWRRMSPRPYQYPSLYIRTDGWFNWRKKYYHHHVKVHLHTYPNRRYHGRCKLDGRIPTEVFAFFSCNRGLASRGCVRRGW